MFKNQFDANIKIIRSDHGKKMHGKNFSGISK